VNTATEWLRNCNIGRELIDLQCVVEDSREILQHEEWPDLAFKYTEAVDKSTDG